VLSCTPFTPSAAPLEARALLRLQRPAAQETSESCHAAATGRLFRVKVPEVAR